MNTQPRFFRNLYSLLPSAAALALVALTPSVAHAAFLTGFEPSAGYTNGQTIIGVHDVNAPAGQVWENQFAGSHYNPIATTAHPYGSSTQNMRMVDSGTGSGDNSNARLNLTNAIDLTKPFVLQFSLAVVAQSGSGSFGVTFGDSSYNVATSASSWFIMNIDSASNISIVARNPSNGTNSFIYIDNFANFANSGGYVSFNVGVDPTTHTYTSLTISGSKKTTDVLATKLSSTQIPWQGSTNPTGYFNIGSTTANMGTLDVGNIALVPEPSTACLLWGAAITLVLFARRRAFSRWFLS